MFFFVCFYYLFVYILNNIGQIELYTHIPVMQQLINQLQQWDFRLCGVFLLDSQFLIDVAKFFSGIMAALSTMVTLEIPHINVMGKLDLLDKKAKKDIERQETCRMEIIIIIAYENSFNCFFFFFFFFF